MDSNITTYKFPKESYSIALPDSSLASFTISCDGSNAIIASRKQLSLFYFKKLYSKHKAKKNFKEILCDLFNNVGAIKMHPFFDEKECFAGCFEKSILIYKVSKNSLTEERNYFSQHSDNIINICWQNCLNGLLASFSTDKIINFYDVKGSRNAIFYIKEEEQIKSIEFCYSNPNLIAVGYQKKLKIFDLTKVLSVYKKPEKEEQGSNVSDKCEVFDSNLKFSPFDSLREKVPKQPSISNLYDKSMKGTSTSVSSLKNIIKFIQPGRQIKDLFQYSSVDLINWYNDDTYLVIGCSNEAVVKIVNFQEMKVEAEINLNASSKIGFSNQYKLIKCYFMKGDSILSICETKFFIHLFNRVTKEVSVSQLIDVISPITSFKLMTSVVSYSYFVYTDQDKNFNLKKYIIEGHNYYSTISANSYLNNFPAKSNSSNNLSKSMLDNLKKTGETFYFTGDSEVNKNTVKEPVMYHVEEKLRRMVFSEIDYLNSKYSEHIIIEYKKPNMLAKGNTTPNNKGVNSEIEQTSLQFDFRLSLDLMIIKLKVIYYLGSRSVKVKPSFLPSLNNDEKEMLKLIPKIDASISTLNSLKTIIDKVYYLMPIVEVIGNNNQHIFTDTSLVQSIIDDITNWEKMSSVPVNKTPIESLLISIFNIIEASKRKSETEDSLNPLQKKNKGNFIKDSHGTCPYLRTIGFCWSPQGNMIIYKSNKIDVKSMCQHEKVIENRNSLQDWVSRCMTGIINSSSNSLTSSQVLIPYKLRKLVKYESPLHINDYRIFESISQRHSNTKIGEWNQGYTGKASRNDNNFNNQQKKELGAINNLDMLNEYLELSNFNEEHKVGFNSFSENISGYSFNKPFIKVLNNKSDADGKTKNGNISCHFVKFDYFEERNFILKKLEVKLLRKDKFFSILNSMLVEMNNDSSMTLYEILNMINYFINSILDVCNSPICKPMVLKHYANNIINILATLEKGKHFSYLFISTLLITTRLCDSLIASKLLIKGLLHRQQNLCSGLEESKEVDNVSIYSNAAFKLNVVDMTSNINHMYLRGKDNNYPRILSSTSDTNNVQHNCNSEQPLKKMKIPISALSVKQSHQQVETGTINKGHRSSSFNNENTLRESTIKDKKGNDKDAIKQDELNTSFATNFHLKNKRKSTNTVQDLSEINVNLAKPLALSIAMPKEKSIQQYFLQQNYNVVQSIQPQPQISKNKSFVSNLSTLNSNTNKFENSVASHPNLLSGDIHKKLDFDDNLLGYKAEYKMDTSFTKIPKDTMKHTKKALININEENNELAINDSMNAEDEQQINSIIDFNLIHIFPKNVYITFCDILYVYSTELYRMRRMIERAQIEKFINILTEGLNITKYTATSSANSLLSTSSFLNSIAKVKKSDYLKESSNTTSFPLKKFIVDRSTETHYDIFKSNNRNSSQKLQCDICGNLLKVGEFTVSSLKYKLQGHYEHLIEYISKQNSCSNRKAIKK